MDMDMDTDNKEYMYDVRAACIISLVIMPIILAIASIEVLVARDAELTRPLVKLAMMAGSAGWFTSAGLTWWIFLTNKNGRVATFIMAATSSSLAGVSMGLHFLTVVPEPFLWLNAVVWIIFLMFSIFISGQIWLEFMEKKTSAKTVPQIPQT